MNTPFYAKFPSVIGWYSRLLMRAAGANVVLLLLIVLVHLLGQVSLMLAFLLPLKVIILLGSDHIPRYFPEFLRGFDRDNLVIGLAACAGGFYVVNTVCGKLSAYLIRKFADDVLGRDTGFVSTTAQVDLARDVLGGFADSLAALSFSLLALAALALIYPALAVVVVAVIVASLLLTVLASRVSSSLNRYLDENPDSLTRPFYTIGFLSCFVFIVADFLLGSDPPTLVYALVGFILSRQLFSGARSAFNRIGALIKRAESVSGMLLVGHTTPTKSQRVENRFWSFVAPTVRGRWIGRAVGSDAPATWYQGGTRGVSLFTVGTTGTTGQDRLLKLFSSPMRHYAEREWILLNQYETFPLSPRPLEAKDVGEFRCHLFRWGNYRRVVKSDRQAARRQLLSQTMLIRPTATLVESNNRSGPGFPERLAAVDLERIRVAVPSAIEAAQLDTLASCMPWIVDLVRKAPLEIWKPSLPDADMALTPSGEVLAIGWGDWALEPVGAAWQRDPKEIGLFREAYAAAQKVRPDCAAFQEELILLTGLMWDLARSYRQQKFSEILEMLPVVLETLAAAEARQSVTM